MALEIRKDIWLRSVTYMYFILASWELIHFGRYFWYTQL